MLHLRPIAPILSLLATLAAGCTPSGTCQCGMPSANVASAHAWKVYAGDELILDISDKPGPITSTAALPPGVPPKQHPFLSANARSASHESKLHDLLEASKSLPEFLKSLEAAGYAVRPLP